jgi:ribosomal protein L25 (general stress protein Ctc)
MQLKTCLLVTDDPDDHQAFSEAFSEISDNTILIVILDSKKASLLLQEKKYVPNYIFVDLSMHGIHINEFMNGVRVDSTLNGIPTILYGEEEELKKIPSTYGMPFFSKDYNYAELRSFLIEILKS